MKAKIQEEFPDRTRGAEITASPVANGKWALDVRTLGNVQNVASDVIDSFAASTNTITAASHVAKVGDRIRFTSGTLDTQELAVYAIATNTIQLAEDLTASPSSSDTFDILRPISQTLTSTGTTTSTLTYKLDGSDQVVIKDTGTPANNRSLPVEISSTSGPISINTPNVNLEVQLDHDSANPDSVQIGDGTETLEISASGEASVIDATVGTNTGTIAGAVAGSEMQVDVITSALPTGASTSANQTTANASLSSIDTDTSTIASDTTSIDGKTPALGTAVIASSVPVNIASDQTVPISAASLPLPAGAATEATLSTIDTDTSALAGTVSGSELQVDIVASLPAGSNTIGAVTTAKLDVIDFFDTPLLAMSSSNIPGSAGSPLQVIASTAAATKAIQVFDTGGEFFGIFTGTAASEVLIAVVGPGSDQTVEVSIPISTRISLLALDTTAISAGNLTMNFLG